MGNISVVAIEGMNGAPLNIDSSGNLSISTPGSFSFESGVGGVSGAIASVLLGWDLSGLTWNPLSVSTSGSNQLNVPVGSVTTNISGQAVFLGSGSFIPISGLFVQVSGQAVFLGSGSAIPLSGLTNKPVLGAPTMASGYGFSGGIATTIAVYDFSGQNWVPLSVIQSGATAPLGVGFESGTNQVQQTIPAKIQIGFSGTAIQSGVPSLSGGTALQSSACLSVILRNSSGNDTMYVGGSPAGLPFSGRGFQLGGGDSVTLPTTNANNISVFAATSGQFVNWIAVNY